MRKLSFFASAVALLLCACSSHDAVEDVTGGNGHPTAAQGYLNVSVNLPTQGAASTRAWQESSPGTLDDGTADEYKVNDVLLVIFSGTTEANAVVKKVVSPTEDTWDPVTDDPNQVTTRQNYVVALPEGVTGPYWVLAVVNPNGVIGSSADGKNVTINGVEKADCKLIDLQNAMIITTNNESKFRNSAGYFFMTNAVLSNMKGGTAGIKSQDNAIVLAPVTKVFVSESEALAADATPSADIYVERGLAKVTLGGTVTFDGDIKISTGSLKTPALSGWVLDNTNLSSYIVRQTLYGDWGMCNQSGNALVDKFRFVGYNNVDAVAAPITTAYRTYWSPDPNYAKDNDGKMFYEPKVKTFPADASAPQYCLENTFDVKRQAYKNTTRAVVAIDLNGGQPFYTVAGDRKTLYTEDDAKADLYKRLINNPDFQTWFLDNRGGAYALDATCFESVVWSSDTKAGRIRAKEVTLVSSKLKAGAKTKLTEIDANILKAVNNLQQLNRFAKGIAYYAIRIKHFGDDLTPWNQDSPNSEYITPPSESGIDDIYPNDDRRDANYLGRYGVLRNNWYVLQLGKILKIGHPIVPWLTDSNKPDDPTDPDDPKDENPEDPDHPDDSLDDAFINARVNILSWAKRIQNWNLK